MEPYFAMGFFALYVVLASLFQHLGESDASLSRVKKIWGYRRGIALHFVAHIGVPLVLGIVFLGRAIADFSPGESAPPYVPTHHYHVLPHLYSRNLSPVRFVHPGDLLSTGEIPHLLALEGKRAFRPASDIGDPFSFFPYIP